MHHVAPVESLPDRSSRAPFKYPVRVTIAGERVVRLCSGDLSASGMFLLMPEPPEAGTVVQLAFEVRGQVLPFAEGEVAWRRNDGSRGGFGVRFTRFLHPRAKALIDFLCDNVEAGTMLKPVPPPAALRRRWSGVAAVAAVAAFLVTTGAAAPPQAVAVMDPSLVCLPEPGLVACPDPVSTVSAPVVDTAPVKSARKAKLPEAPRPTPVVTRTLVSAAKPARLSSTPIPSGAARMVTLSRVSGQLRVAIDAVAGGRVKSVKAFQSPPRVVMDVTGIPPLSEHRAGVDDPEVLSVVAAPVGRLTRVTVNLARQPVRVVQQGDSALLAY